MFFRTAEPAALGSALEAAYRLAAAASGTERELAECEPRLNSVLTTVPFGFGVVRNRAITDLNDWALSMSGYEREELIGKNTRILFADDAEFERVGRDLYAELDEGGVGEIESRYRRKDGTLFEVLLRGTPLDLADPSLGIAFAVLDISERKRIERALESRVLALTRPLEAGTEAFRFEDLFDLEEMQRIQDAFAEATGVASVIIDLDGRPLTTPSNFCRLCSLIIRSSEEGRANCFESDAHIGRSLNGKATIRPCLSGGLWDGGAGIMVGDTQVANWLIGQILDESSDLEAVRNYAAKIGADQGEFDAALAEVPRMSLDRFEKVSRALFLIGNQLSALAYRNAQQARAIAERKHAEESLRESSEALKLALVEKEALYKELKHRVKNGMAVIAGLIGLESGNARSEEAREVLESTRTRVESLSILYDLLGGDRSPNAVRIDSYLTRILASIASSLLEEGDIEFRTEFDPLMIHARTAAPLGLLLMEAVTNSIKYAFPDGGADIGFR